MKYSTVAALALVLAPVNAQASWNGTDWGMSPAEVETATGAKAKTIKPKAKDRDGIGKLGNTGSFADGEFSYSTEYYYDERGLKSVVLTPRKANCQNEYKRLIQKFGKQMRHSNQLIIQLFIWHDGQNRIRFLVDGNLKNCWTHIERLDDYREIDLKAAN